MTGLAIGSIKARDEISEVFFCFVFSSSSSSCSCSSSPGEDKTFRTQLLDTFVLVLFNLHWPCLAQPSYLQVTVFLLLIFSHLFIPLLVPNCCSTTPWNKKHRVQILLRHSRQGINVCTIPRMAVKLGILSANINWWMLLKIPRCNSQSQWVIVGPILVQSSKGHCCDPANDASCSHVLHTKEEGSL